MISRAIVTKQLEFLYCVFAYNQNFERIGGPEPKTAIVEKRSSGIDEEE